MDENGDFIERLRHELLKVVTSVTIVLLSRRAKNDSKRNVWTRMFGKWRKNLHLQLCVDGALATPWGNLYDVPG